MKMTNERLLRLIHEADIPEENVWMLAINRLESGLEMLDRLVSLAMNETRREEREACAQECDAQRSPQMLAEGDWSSEGEAMARECARAIRARTQ